MDATAKSLMAKVEQCKDRQSADATDKGRRMFLKASALLGVTAGASQLADSIPHEQPVSSSAPIQLLSSDTDGITFAVEVSGVEIMHELISGIEYDIASIPGFGSSATAGSPQMPTRRRPRPFFCFRRRPR